MINVLQSRFWCALAYCTLHVVSSLGIARPADTVFPQTCWSLLALLAVALTVPAAGQLQYPPGSLHHPGEAELILPEETQQVAVVAAHDLHAAATGEFTAHTTIVLFPNRAPHTPYSNPLTPMPMGRAERHLASGYHYFCLISLTTSTCLNYSSSSHGRGL